jgi:hypothetical protein
VDRDRQIDSEAHQNEEQGQERPSYRVRSHFSRSCICALGCTAKPRSGEMLKRPFQLRWDVFA